MKYAPSPFKSTMRLRRSWTVRGARSKNRAMQSGAHLDVAAGLALLIDQLCDIGEGRIANMDAAGIDVQVLSLTAPGVEQLDAAETVAFARVTNDTLAEAVHRHPDRLPGFAALPTAEPDAAADELRRRVNHAWFPRSLDQRSQPRPLPG
jgi:uncharacterized protein